VTKDFVKVNNNVCQTKSEQTTLCHLLVNEELRTSCHDVKTDLVYRCCPPSNCQILCFSL